MITDSERQNTLWHPSNITNTFRDSGWRYSMSINTEEKEKEKEKERSLLLLHSWRQTAAPSYSPQSQTYCWRCGWSFFFFFLFFTVSKEDSTIAILDIYYTKATESREVAYNGNDIICWPKPRNFKTSRGWQNDWGNLLRTSRSPQ